MDSNPQRGAAPKIVYSSNAVDPEEILRRLHDAHPEADKPQLRGLFLDYLDGIDVNPCKRVLGAGWYDAKYHFVIRSQPLSVVADMRSARDKRAAYIKQKIVSNLLDWQLPNGKRLGDCTGRECRKAGGWLVRVAAKVPPRKLVRDVLDQGELQKLWDRRA